MRLSSSYTPPKTSGPMTCRVRRRTITTGRATPARWLRSGPPTSRPGCRSSFSTPNTSRPWSMRSCKPATSKQQSVYPGIPGHEPDVAQGQQQAAAVTAAMAPVKALREQPASYFNETDYFQADWQTAFWGDHYARLLQVKNRYDPGGLFFVHHGVGTETASAAANALFPARPPPTNGRTTPWQAPARRRWAACRRRGPGWLRAGSGWPAG